MFERYTEKARSIIFFARYEASQFGSPYVETEHLLLGLLREDKALAHRFLKNHAAIESIRKQVETRTVVREKTSTSVDLPLSHECKRVLAYTYEEAKRLNHELIDTGHLLFGLLREEKSFAAEILHERGLRLFVVREEIVRSPPETASETGTLEIARQYLKAIEEGASVAVLAKFFDPEIVQTEFPNRITPKGVKRGLFDLARNFAEEQRVTSNQSYTILHEFAAENLVIFEVLWEGTLAASLQSLPPGATIRANIAIFLKFRNGKIIQQHNYNCFEPFPGE